MYYAENMEFLKCIAGGFTLYISGTQHLFFILPEYDIVFNGCNIHLYLHVSVPELHPCCIFFCNLDACWIYIQLNILLP